MFDSHLDQVLAKYDYSLSENKIANQPVSPRDHSKLLVLDRQSGQFTDNHFYELPDFLGENDVLVLNETKVFAARLIGKKQTGGKVELLLIKQIEDNAFEAISKPGLKLGQKLFFPRRDYFKDQDLDLDDLLQAEVVFRDEDSAKVKVVFNRRSENLLQEIDLCGLTPLPPYIHSKQSEVEIRQE